MSTGSDAVAIGAAARRLTRGVTATWWYTLSAVVFFELILAMSWTLAVLAAGFPTAAVAVVGIGGLIWLACTVPLLLAYRHRTEQAPLARWSIVLVPLIASTGYGVATGLITGLWVVAAFPVLQTVVLFNWQSGTRLRVVLAATVLLIALCVVDGPIITANSGRSSWWFVVFYSTFLPAMTVFSLWWWDVLIALDRARASEARLAATQERLRVATDVHDLQGHHLQVIALQLELAERLMATDPDAALAQLRLGRASVDDARQGTRDLATRFRSVSLGDEVANAADLLRAAGTTVEVSIAADADRAPSDVLGPAIRETTTNVLRHGAGGRAGLTLRRDGSSWRYEVVNDVVAGAAPAQDGAGLPGLARRAAEAGGALEIRRGDDDFSVAIVVPDEQGGAR
ncbi:histidine kinase [Planococcus sp. APC 4015]|nr:histidine kinase [Planococcus sp. APC 4015]